MTTLALPTQDTETIPHKHTRPERDKISKFAQKRNLSQTGKAPANKNTPNKNTPNKKIDITKDDPDLDSDGSPKSLPQKLSMILAMAWHDKYLKEALIENPIDVSRLLGVELPEGVSLKAEEIRGNCCITIMEYSPEMGIHRRGMSLQLNLIAEL